MKNVMTMSLDGDSQRPKIIGTTGNAPTATTTLYLGGVPTESEQHGLYTDGLLIFCEFLFYF